MPFSKSKLILIVEDDANTADVMFKALRNDYDVIIAVDGESALKVLDERMRELRLAIVDIMLPGISGIEVAENLAAAGVPYLVTSATNDKRLIKSAMSHGAHSFIPKPASPKYIREAVHDAFTLPRDVVKLIGYYKDESDVKFAVGLLASANMIPEADADRVIRAKARTARLSKAEMARRVIDGFNLMLEPR